MNAKQAIGKSKNLRELCQLACEFNQELANTNLAAQFPTFGGEEPRDTRGIFSWDEQSLLVQNFEDADKPFVIIPRDSN